MPRPGHGRISASRRPGPAAQCPRPLPPGAPPAGPEVAASRVGTARTLGSLLYGIASNILALSSQSRPGPAGGASDDCGLGRRAAGPGRRCTTAAAGALRVIV